MTGGEAEPLQARLRSLPGVDRVLEELGDQTPHPIRAEAARAAVDRAREDVRRGGAPTFDRVVADARALVADHQRSLLQRVINATGVLIHTNLGRAPLGPVQLDAVARVAGGYSNLEYDLGRGRRGSRYAHAQRLLVALTGAEAALVVNNNAAAVLLVLAALCAGRDVIISRGELIEIGGEFRIPDVMEASGARLVEAGTTNRTHMGDYERAIGPDTAAILKVHPSNYRVVGFTAEVEARELARLARGRGVLLIHDVGSGLIATQSDVDWARSEPPVDVAVANGADVVTFSGDKLLGGPQAGVILARSDLAARIGRHPLLRAVRPDKMTLAALEATLAAYLDGRPLDLPLWRMALTPADDLERRATALAARLTEQHAVAGVKAEAVATSAVTGGGSLPGAHLGSWAVAVTHAETGAADLEQRLRAGTPPVVGRIEDDRLLLDLRTVEPADDEVVAAAVAAAARVM